jgi:hypothetical protein
MHQAQQEGRRRWQERQCRYRPNRERYLAARALSLQPHPWPLAVGEFDPLPDLLSWPQNKSRHGAFSYGSSVKEETPMKTFISILTLALAIGFPAFAGDVPATKAEADCQKAGGNWDAKTKTCSGKY